MPPGVVERSRGLGTQPSVRLAGIGLVWLILVSSFHVDTIANYSNESLTSRGECRSCSWNSPKRSDRLMETRAVQKDRRFRGHETQFPRKSSFVEFAPKILELAPKVIGNAISRICTRIRRPRNEISSHDCVRSRRRDVHMRSWSKW